MNPLEKAKSFTQYDATKRAVSLLDEFKKFAFKGNVVDLAIGVIIGAAFTTIVKSLVDDIIMPLLGVFLPGQKGYEGWKIYVGEASIPFGKFLAAVVNFLIIALVLYLFTVKFLGWLMKTKKEEAPPPPTPEQQLLMEIRDLLKEKAA